MKSLVVVAGAAITMAEASVICWLAHKWLAERAPGVAAWIPRDGGAVVGLLIGGGIVARWMTG